jgi:predicted nucleic acid-binding protein
MTRVLLDTSAYSAFLRGHPGIVAEVRRAAEIHVNAVILGELLAGFGGGKREEHNRSQLRSFLASPRVRVAPLDSETSERYAHILHALRRTGRPIPTNDLWIAATAMQLGLSVLTTDRHFQQVGQIVVSCHEVGDG